MKHLEEMLGDNPAAEQRVLEGAIQKFKAGIKSQYIDRYCVLTNLTFQCFTGQWTPQPLFSIPLEHIVQVTKGKKLKRHELDKADQVPTERCFVIEVSDELLNSLQPQSTPKGRAGRLSIKAQVTPDNKISEEPTITSTPGETAEKTRDTAEARPSLEGRASLKGMVGSELKRVLTEQTERKTTETLNTKASWRNRTEEWSNAEKNMVFRCSTEAECDKWIRTITESIALTE